MMMIDGKIHIACFAISFKIDNIILGDNSRFLILEQDNNE